VDKAAVRWSGLRPLLSPNYTQTVVSVERNSQTRSARCNPPRPCDSKVDWLMEECDGKSNALSLREHLHKTSKFGSCQIATALLGRTKRISLEWFRAANRANGFT
jgi:hypothetical protein